MKILLSNIKFISNKLPFVLIVVFFILMTYLFFSESFSFNGAIYTNVIYEHFSKMSWWLYSIFYISILLFISSITILILSAYFISKKARVLKLENELEFLYSKELIDYLYSEKYDDEIFDYFKKNIKNDIAINTLFKTIIKIQELHSEDFKYKFSILLKETKVDGILEDYIYSHSKLKKILAFKIVSYLGIEKYKEYILKYLNHNNDSLRYEAIISYAKLSGDSNLDFLLDSDKHVSKMTINTIYNIVSRNIDSNASYEKLLHSDNPRIKSISLLLDGNIDSDTIKLHINDSDEFLSDIAWDLYSKKHNDVNFIIDKYDDGDQNDKIYIMTLLQNIDMDYTTILEFLDRVIMNDSLLLKMYALKLLFKYDADLFLEYKRVDNIKIQIVCNEILELNSYL